MTPESENRWELWPRIRSLVFTSGRRFVLQAQDWFQARGGAEVPLLQGTGTQVVVTSLLSAGTRCVLEVFCNYGIFIDLWTQVVRCTCLNNNLTSFVVVVEGFFSFFFFFVVFWQWQLGSDLEDTWLKVSCVGFCRVGRLREYVLLGGGGGKKPYKKI